MSQKTLSSSGFYLIKNRDGMFNNWSNRHQLNIKRYFVLWQTTSQIRAGHISLTSSGDEKVWTGEMTHRLVLSPSCLPQLWIHTLCHTSVFVGVEPEQTDSSHQLSQWVSVWEKTLKRNYSAANQKKLLKQDPQISGSREMFWCHIFSRQIFINMLVL